MNCGLIRAVKSAVLSQILPAADDRKVWDVVASGLGDAVRLRAAYDLLANNSDDASMRKLEHLQHELEAVDGWMLEQRVERVLTRLKLDGDVFNEFTVRRLAQ